MKALILYHGTLTANVQSILKNGLRPRGKSKRRSHDEYLGSPSLREFVYLASTAKDAADHIIRISERRYNGAPVTLLQIDVTGLDTTLAYPDEDWLRTEWNSDMCEWSHRKQLAYMKRHQDEWENSLNQMHTLAYRGVVTPSLITVCGTECDPFINDRRGYFKEQVRKWERVRDKHKEAA